jgi:hypothetical protein
MGVGSGKSIQMLNFEENGSIFCEWRLPQTSARSEETLQRTMAGRSRMIEGYG